MTRRTHELPRPQMNVTPLVDVVLVLLIIFMVVMPMMENGAAVELPTILNIDEERKGKTDPITLSLSRDGAIYLERDPVADARLESELRRIHTNEPTRRIVLRGDRGVTYERARSLFGLCQRVGFPGVSLQVNERAR